MSLSTPVAFLIFNRPDLTERVFGVIRQVRPEKLLVVADGPRFPEEAEKCKKARSIIDRVDWDCEILTNFSEINMGCKYRVSSGLNWVFSEVEEAIILEDDCFPDLSFFEFCQTLLRYYKDDQRVMVISGSNFQLEQTKTPNGYFFSKYPNIWGWACWRRAWKHFDIDMKSWPESKELGLIQSWCDDPYEQKYWEDIFDKTYNGEIDTWDYQWHYSVWVQHGLTIAPKANLVSNLGFARSDATHTNYEAFYAQLPTTSIYSISHLYHMIRDKRADDYAFDHRFGGKDIKEADKWYSGILWNLAVVKAKAINILQKSNILKQT